MHGKHIGGTPLTMLKGHRPFTKELSTILALCINYVCAYLFMFIWKQDYCYYATISVTSLLAGIVIVDFKRSLFYVGISLLVGAAVTVGINVAPLIMYGAQYLVISTVIFAYAQTLALSLMVTFPLCIVAALIGCFIGEAIQ